MKVEFSEKKKSKKRVGRGSASGFGKTSGRGTKGQKSRTGKKIKRGFEGGQNPLKHRIPKLRGFKALGRKDLAVVNVSRLEVFASDEEVNPKTLFERKIIRKKQLVKILGEGKLTKKLIISDCVVSKKAEEKIKKAGGEIENA